MKIGELARRSGLATSTIRFYESKGLLRMADRQANGYRAYPPEAVAVLAIIASAQQAGFTLEEIRHLLPQDITQWQHDDLLAALQKKIADIEALQTRLAQNKAHLQSLVQQITTKPATMTCQDNAVRVMERLGIGAPQCTGNRT